MSGIDIHHAHSLPADKARDAVQQVADKLSDRFGAECTWQGDTLHFKRAGIDGHIVLLPNALHLSAKLGFLMSAMQGPIEAEIRRVLEERFA
jgi:putative polyhydroxyalkanoate system protein